MTKAIFLKKTKRYVFVKENQDKTLTLTDAKGNPVPDEWSLLHSNGGIQGILTRCQNFDKSPEELCAELSERLRKARKRSAEIAAEQKWRHDKEAVAAFKELAAQHNVIPATTENISIVMKYLNTMNWGVWDLPKMSIGYRAAQYNFEGISVVTIVLDKPVDGETRYRTAGAPRYLTNYQQLR